MARSMGPVLAAGGITVMNQSVFNGKPIDWRVIAATGLTAGVFALLERPLPTATVGLAWLMLVTLTLTRIDPSIPSPAESALKWWREGAGKDTAQ